eukprot:TRINITY_DN4662_c1_g1_i2.p1 TRINITY_DN4662_c1_g1~~TRINITY_DN4662_c1_g1_i2.p1  ORF type:complete len:356 (-),score=66.38 TRINITY_DN4662_c1_g1_i2:401-1402(-)
MEFWKKGWEQASKHAQEAAEKAKKLAAEATVSAKTYAKSALQDTKEHLKNLSFDSVIDSIQIGAQTLTETPPTQEELHAYGITTQLEDYLRTLTYSTFRDYPKSKLRGPKSQNGAFLLSPWQIRHVTLILDRVKEIQDLRFVLCPQRMDETVFWQIYFTLTTKYLPKQAQEGLEQDISQMKGLHVLEEEEEEGFEEEDEEEYEQANSGKQSKQIAQSNYTDNKTSSSQQQISGSQQHDPEKTVSPKSGDQQTDSGVAGPSHQTADGEAEENDLDQYIKDVLDDGDDLKDDDIVDLENDEELEKYLNQLDGDEDLEDADDIEELVADDQTLHKD